MTRWCLVPSEPTEGMVEAGYNAPHVTHYASALEDAYAAMLTASPDPSKDEELVARVARCLIETRTWAGAWERANDVERDNARFEARAILSLFTEKGDE